MRTPVSIRRFTLLMASVAPAWALIAAVTDGFSWRVGPIRVSSTEPVRPVLVGIAAGVIWCFWQSSDSQRHGDGQLLATSLKGLASLAVPIIIVLSLVIGVRYGTFARGLTLLIRPNLLLLTLAPPIAWNDRLSAARAYITGLAPLIFVIAAINRICGSPVSSGYGGIGDNYAIAPVAERHEVHDVARSDARAARCVDVHTPASDVVLAIQHSGSVRYYAGRAALRYDRLPRQDWIQSFTTCGPKAISPTSCWMIGK